MKGKGIGKDEKEFFDDLKGRDKRKIEGIGDEIIKIVDVIRIDKGIEKIGIIIGCEKKKNIGVGRFIELKEKRIGFRIKEWLKRKIGIEKRKIKILKRKRKMWRVKLKEFKIIRILSEIRRDEFKEFGDIKIDKEIIGKEKKRK